MCMLMGSLLLDKPRTLPATHVLSLFLAVSYNFGIFCAVSSCILRAIRGIAVRVSLSFFRAVSG